MQHMFLLMYDHKQTNKETKYAKNVVRKWTQKAENKKTILAE